MLVVLQSVYISYKAAHTDPHVQPRNEPAAATGARLHDPREPPTPPASSPRRARGGFDHFRLQLARPARGDDIDAPAHDEHGGGRG